MILLGNSMLQEVRVDRQLALQMRVGVVLETVVVILAVRLFRSEPLQKSLEVPVQSAFVVVDEDRGGDVHGVAEHQPFADARLGERLLDLRRDVHEHPPGRQVHHEFFPETFHIAITCDSRGCARPRSFRRRRSP